MLNYSKLNKQSTENIDGLFNNIQLSPTTIGQRKRLKASLDKFSTFKWRGLSAFRNFGAFIINKNDLRFFNGPSFSNAYTKPQFESSTNLLTGVDFQVQKINFNIGVYWITEEHYRQLMHWLNPYEINTLMFDFEPRFYYQVKLSGTEDSVRYIIGYEPANYTHVATTVAELESMLSENPNWRIKYTGTKGRTSTNINIFSNYVYTDIDFQEIGRATEVQPAYYTEMRLSFEIQGAPCAYSAEPYIFVHETEEPYTSILYQVADNVKVPSPDINTPIDIFLSFDLNTDQDIKLAGTTWYFNEEIQPWTGQFPGNLHFISKETQYYGLSRMSSGDSWNLRYEPFLSSAYNSSTGWADEEYRLIHFNDNVEMSDLVYDWLEENATRVPEEKDIILSCQAVAHYSYEIEGISYVTPSKELFDIELQNLTFNGDEGRDYHFNLSYDSETGLLYMQHGHSQIFLLNTLSTSAYGQRVVKAMKSSIFNLPGKFNDPLFDINNLKIEIIINVSVDGENQDPIMEDNTLVINDIILDLNRSGVFAIGRTNLI